MIELQQYARKNKPNLHILNKLQEEMTKLAKERVGNDSSKFQKNCITGCLEVILNILMVFIFIYFNLVNHLISKVAHPY